MPHIQIISKELMAKPYIRLANRHDICLEDKLDKLLNNVKELEVCQRDYILCAKITQRKVLIVKGL